MQAQAQCQHEENRYVPACGSLADFAGPPPPDCEVDPEDLEPAWRVVSVCAGCRQQEGYSVEDFDTFEEAQAHATLLELADIMSNQEHRLHGPEERCSRCGSEEDRLGASLFGEDHRDDED